MMTWTLNPCTKMKPLALVCTCQGSPRDYEKSKRSPPPSTLIYLIESDKQIINMQDMQKLCVLFTFYHQLDESQRCLEEGASAEELPRLLWPVGISGGPLF